MVFFYRRFLPLDVFKYAFGAENDAFLTAVRSPHGSGVINAIHYRSAASLPQICLSPYQTEEAVSNDFAFETASLFYVSFVISNIILT